MTPARRTAFALLWLAVLGLLGLWASRGLEMRGDLRSFMPGPDTPAQRLLMDELGEGPGARLLLLGIADDAPEALARQSRALATRLRAAPRIALVANGDADLSAIPERLRPYRYLLSPRATSGGLDADALRDALTQRMADLGSPAAELVEPLIERDPTLEMLHLAERWQPAGAPRQQHGVWFSRDGRTALLAVQTHAAGFDPEAQARAVHDVREAFAAVQAGSRSTLTVSGPGAIAMHVAERTRREASLIGTFDSIAFVLVLLVAYRSWRAPLLGALPLATAGLVGLAAVAALFDGVHGITVAFGFTLIGVAQDYPIHLFSHQRAGVSPWQSARVLWPTLGTGVAATCIAYLTFLASGVDGLRQLAVFTIAGLGSAALATRFLLPALIDPVPRDAARSARLRWLWRRIAALPRLGPRGGAVLAALALAAVFLAPGTAWENDLSRLTPVPRALLADEARLRRELGAPDVRYLVTVPGSDVEQALQRSERLLPALERLRTQGAVGGFDLAARYVPSAATQRVRQAALPNAALLSRNLDAALAGTPFLPGVFQGFVDDVQRAREAPPLHPADLAGTPLAGSVEGLLLARADGATAVVTLHGLREPAAVAAAVAPLGAQLVDLKQASESLVAEYRTRILAALTLAAVLLSLTVWRALRVPARVLRVLAPMALTTLLIVAALRLCGVELNLFHLVALILAAGLGLDYALFFDHAGDAHDEQLRALHAICVCSLVTFVVFAMLAGSSIPVLRAIGSTVALGVACNFVLALAIVRRPTAELPA